MCCRSLWDGKTRTCTNSGPAGAFTAFPIRRARCLKAKSSTNGGSNCGMSRCESEPRSTMSTTGFTLDDLDELAGDVAAEANHVKDRELQKELNPLYAR